MKSYNSSKMKKFIWTSLVLTAVLSLSACSDTGSGPNPLPPSLHLEFRQVNIFHFTWTDIDGETLYRLLEDPDGASGYSVIATINANTTSMDLYVSLPDRITAIYMLQALRKTEFY